MRASASRTLAGRWSRTAPRPCQGTWGTLNRWSVLVSPWLMVISSCLAGEIEHQRAGAAGATEAPAHCAADQSQSPPDRPRAVLHAPGALANHGGDASALAREPPRRIQ